MCDFLNNIEIQEKRSGGGVLIGLLLICMALASLLTVRGLSNIPEEVTVNLINEDFTFDVHGFIHLLATPAQYVGDLWGDESMIVSIAFLFLGFGLSLFFRKKIVSAMRANSI